ncbi:PEP-CTERM/exosortase system-associated acyltransferase [Uliginosibacterium sp. H1]|uniref:PEP-CTERM/exosortase system-associated acyltransferase n=1 Tax=Uliginosibacterium sp. H1 TaxID=3114757 RepID=UPI002E1830F7|nr:PEP-CTERM/exosortase system-associated acyltransferase [Uliginosibacterium sp. H1]
MFGPFNLGEGFKKYFEIVPAIDDDVRHAVYRIRHEVYCEELRYEAERPDRMESDEYDQYSQHCLMRQSGPPLDLVGCTRLVLARRDSQDCILPFEKLCEASINRRIVDPAALPRESIAEVSRLAVRSRYRRRKGDEKREVVMNKEDFGTKDMPRFPYIPVGLYLGTVALAKRQGVETLFVLTEPRLADHFSKIGVKIHPIGAPIQHRGTRLPSMMKVDEIIKGLRMFMKPLWRTINEQVDAAYEAGKHREMA